MAEAYSNPVFSSADGTFIDVQLTLPSGEVAPSTLSASDPHTVDLFAVVSKAGGIAAYVQPVTAPIFIPASAVRSRLQAAGLWAAAVAAMTPAQIAEFCTLEQGVSPSDPTVLALLSAIGANPAAILAA